VVLLFVDLVGAEDEETGEQDVLLPRFRVGLGI